MVTTPADAANATQITPSRVFPLPNAFYNGKQVTAASITPHGGVASNIGGSDIPADKGTTIVSITSGTLISAAYDPYGGNVVLMKGNDGNIYYYAHMLAPYKGSSNIAAGQLLGQVDNSGNAANTIPHLHIGICTGTNANCIQDGTGANGGIGNGNLDAVAMLKALAADPRANNQQIADSANGAPGSTPVNPPNISAADIINQIQTNPALAALGFTPANAAAIALNVQEALKNNIDPFTWIAIVAHESNFKDGVVNPSSGACGYAQLDPCPSGQQWGVANIDAGIAKFKAFMAQCNNDLTCALDLHYSGGMPGYANTITNIANQIKTANPNLVDLVNQLAANFPTLGSPPPSSGGGGSGGFGSGTTPDCTPPGGWSDVGGIFNYAGCVVHQAIENMITSFKDWWGKWQTAHVPQVMFVVVGLIVAALGLILLGMDNSDKISPVAKAVKGATKGSAESAKPTASKEAPAAADVGEHLPSAAADAVTDVVAM